MPKQGDEDGYILGELRQQRLIPAASTSGYFSKSPSVTPAHKPSHSSEGLKQQAPLEPKGKSKSSGKQ
jgi:hypothetical protein